MNGVRRFLGGITPPASATSSDDFPDSDAPPMPQAATPGLAIRKPKSPSSDYGLGSPIGSLNGNGSVNGGGSLNGSNGLGLKLNGAVNGNSHLALSSPGAGPSRSRTPAQTRDALLMSLLASEAVVDARDYPVLDAEELDELKKERDLLQPRLAAAQRTLARETKMLAAAQNLSRLNASTTGQLPLTSGTTLAAAEARVDAAQRALWKLKEASGELGVRIVQHQAAVLGATVRELEEAANPDALDAAGFGVGLGGASSPLMSPSSNASSTAQSRFDGPHLFAGHARAVAPKAPRARLGAQELAALESAAAELTQTREEMRIIVDELNRARDDLAAMEEERARWEEERAAVLRERDGWEDERAAWDDERARWEDERAQVDEELAGRDEERARLDEERAAWDAERAQLEEERAQLLSRSGDAAQDQAAWEAERTAWAAERAAWVAEKEGWVGERQALEAAAGDASAGAAAAVALDLAEERRARAEEKAAVEKDRAAWEAERAALEEQIAELTIERAGFSQEREELEGGREAWAQEREQLLDTHAAELDDVRGSLRGLIDAHQVPLFARDNSVAAYVDALDRHLASGTGASPEEVKEWEGKLAQEAEKSAALAAELEAARTELKALEVRLEEGVPSTPTEARPDNPLSFATDAERIVSVLQPLWTMLPSAETRAAKLGPRFRAGASTPSSPRVGAAKGHPGSPSISDADVRALKGLYSPRAGAAVPEEGKPGNFSVEALASRVRALVTDDRALIERLLRFAQAHDMLRKNADRAQKLAQDSGSALGVYQQQVTVLEAREGEYKAAIARLEQEISEQETVIESLRAIETSAGEQAGTVTELTEANASLSARVLALAQEAADAAKERDELRGAGETQQSQQFALLDELNAVQTENGKLRAQLRSLGKL